MSATGLWSRFCYEPGAWLQRAHHLRNLGYPELAIGDAFKARLLLQAKLHSLKVRSTPIGWKVTNPPGTTPALLDGLQHDILLFLTITLETFHDYLGMQELCEEARKLYPFGSRIQAKVRGYSSDLASEDD